MGHDNDNGELVTVELVGLPLLVAHRSNEHHATLTRELAFVDAANDPATTPARLLSLAGRLAQKYASISRAQQERARAVAAAGGSAVDLTYEVTREMADDAAALFGLYEEVDEFCRSGELVSLVMPADVLAFRRWVSEQFQSQIRSGVAPTPWKAPAELTATESTPAARSRTERIAIHEDLDLEGGARLRNVVAQQVELGVTDLEVDMADCGFVDSAGISMLLTTLARLRGAGGSLVLVNVTAAVKRTLEYSGVDEMLSGG